MFPKIPPSFLILLWLLAFNNSLVNAQKKQPTSSDFCKVSFHLIAKLIMVEATVNNKKGLFIIDTGSPELILNAAWFKNSKIKNSIGDITDNSTQLSTRYVAFSLRNIHLKKKRALIADLRHLEANRKIQILGIIGFSILKNFELILDYRAKEIWLFPAKKKIPRHPFLKKPSHVIPFYLKGHLPVVQITIGTHVLEVILDTGAGINMLRREWQNLLQPHCADSRPIIVKSFHPQALHAFSAFLHGVSLADISFPPMRTFFKQLKSPNLKRIDGIFGYELLRHYTVAFNFPKREWSLWVSEDWEEVLASLKLD